MEKHCNVYLDNSVFNIEKKNVNIGRISSCEIQITDGMMSKHQAQISLSEKGWILNDGYNGKASTNGTW